MPSNCLHYRATGVIRARLCVGHRETRLWFPPLLSKDVTTGGYGWYTKACSQVVRGKNEDAGAQIKISQLVVRWWHPIGAMKLTFSTNAILPLAFASALLMSGCQSKSTNPEQQQAANQPAPPNSTMAPNSAPPNSTMAPAQPAPSTMAPAPAPPPPPVVYTVPAGTRISVSLTQEISSKTATEGQPFSATVARPVVVNGKVIIRSGASASGVVVATKSRGRFKGEGYLELRLDSVRADGHTYPVETETVERVEKGKGKRTAGFIGGGGGFGALVGGLAGGGKGALIGGLAGAGAGTAGSAFTGNKPIDLPAETVLTFRLTNKITVR